MSSMLLWKKRKLLGGELQNFFFTSSSVVTRFCSGQQIVKKSIDRKNLSNKNQPRLGYRPTGIDP